MYQIKVVSNMLKLSVQITCVVTLMLIKGCYSANLEIDCYKDSSLPVWSKHNKDYCACATESHNTCANKVDCFKDCFKESNLVCYSDTLINKALSDGINFYENIKIYENELLSEDILLKVLECTNSSAAIGPLSDSILNIYDTSHIIEISLGFLGKALDDQSTTSNRRKSNRAFNHFAHRTKSSCGYDISSVCNSDVTEDCTNFSTIRSYNGICNNLKKKQLGAALTPYFSMINPQYDSKTTDFGSMNAREMSAMLNATKRIKYQATDAIPNLVFMWGLQVFAHEVGFLQDFQYRNGTFPPKCCGYNGNPKLPTFLQNRHCMPIYIPSTDPVFGSSKNCIEFSRAQRGHDQCQFAQPRFVNAVPTAIDGNFIYGPDIDTNLGTRDANMLNFAKDDAGRRKVGDVRASQTGGLYMMHEIFTHFHDMAVDELGDYEQARKFVGGTIQKILFDMWAVALGKTLTEKYGLLDRTDCYDPNIPLVTLTEFSQVAGRFAHEFIPDYVNFHYKNSTIVSENFLQLFGLSSIDSEENRNALLCGMAQQPIRRKGVSYVIQNEFPSGCDLYSIDSQREKDAEVEAYIKYLKYFKATCINHFDDLVNFDIMTEKNVEVLRKAYKSVNNIPLSMGARLECVHGGSIFPPTNAHIIIDQLKRLQCGDRYFWTRKEINSAKTIAAIKKITIKELICCYGKGYITELPANSFLTEGPNNPIEKCKCRKISDILNL